MAGRIEKILWSRKNLGLVDFVRVYEDKLPLITMVKQTNDLRLSRDQVLFVGKLTSQQRVQATDSKGRSWSIPVDYPIKFSLLESGNFSEGRLLSQIVGSLRLPITAKFAECPDPMFSCTGEEDFRLGELMLTEITEEKFLPAYKINNGVLDGRVVAMPTDAKVEFGVAQGYGGSESQLSDWQIVLSTIATITDVTRLDSSLTEILGVSASESSDPERALVPTARRDKETLLPLIHLDERLPPEPAPTRPPKRIKEKAFSAFYDVIWSKQEYNVKEFFETFAENLPQIIMVTTGIYGPTDMETFGAEETMHISTYARQTRVIAMDPNNQYMSIPLTYPIRMQIVESAGKYSEPYTLKEIIDTSILPVRVRFVQGGGNFQQQSDSSSYIMKELELQDTYKETYFLGHGFYFGQLTAKVVVMPIYLDINMVVAEGWTFGKPEEWPNFCDKLMEAAAETDFNIPTVNTNIAMYSPGQVNVGENIYEYIIPHGYVTLSPEVDEVQDKANDIKTQTTPTPRNYCAVTREPSVTNHYVNLQPKPKPLVKDKQDEKSWFMPPPPMKNPNLASRPPMLPPKSPTDKKCSSVKTRPLPSMPDEKPEVSPKPDLKSHVRISPLIDVHKKRVSSPKATVPPFEYAHRIAATQAPTKTLASSALKTRGIQKLSDIPDNISCLTISEVADCLRLLNLGQFADTSQHLLIDGFMLKEFTAEDFQNDPNFKMSVTQSKMLVRFAQDGWRPRYK